MEDYPQDLTEFEARFANEAACRDYLFRLRWPDGFHCPRCGGSRAWPLRSVLLECAACRYQTSVTAGTIFQDTRKPLTLWFRAMWWVTSQKNGASALGFAEGIGTGKLQDSLDVAAQTAAGDGASGTRSSLGRNRGGRNLYWRSGRGRSRATDGNQGLGGHCCGRGWGGDWTHPDAPHTRRVGGESAPLCGGGCRAW